MTRISSQRDTLLALKIRQKRFNQFRRGRVNSAKEVREDLILQRNLSSRFSKILTRTFNKFVKVNAYLYGQTGIFNPAVAAEGLEEDLRAQALDHYKRIFRAVYIKNEEKYRGLYKDRSIYVFGRVQDFDTLVEQHFGVRENFLVNISNRMAVRIFRRIQILREENMTLEEISRALAQEFAPIGRARAALIARTETHGAATAANWTYHKKVADEFGVNMKKKWVATVDDRTRSHHSDANGQVVGMEESFVVDGVNMKYAGDPAGGAKNVINCRCQVVYVDEEDEF